ncbi:MAK10-like protein [Tanacetum coccineum]|uniref:MAK10-like protein n=1 Tax=Tanacetum coccineum TaxID=301880 RepID=A0ABQ4YCJ7_9ASTR
MENPEQAFVDYASLRTDEAGDKWFTFKPEKNNLGDTYNPSWKIHQTLDQPQVKTLTVNKIETREPKEPEKALEDEFKDLHLNLSVLEVLAHAPMYNVILDIYVESIELGKNRSAFIQGEMPKKMKDPGLFNLPCRLGDSNPFDTVADLGSCVNLIPLYLFKTLNIRILEETENVPGLADGTKSYPVGIVKNIEVYVGKLKLLDDFYVIDMEKDPTCLLLVERGLATTSAVIDSNKAKIAVGEGVARSIFGIKEIGLGHVDTPYWTTLAKRKSYEVRPSTNYIGSRRPYYLEKDFMNNHLLGELEIARDAELNPFKDVLVFRNMVEFLGVIPINLKGNMWESKEEDGTWHIRIEMIDLDGENFDRIFQSFPTTMKLSEKEKPSDIIDLEHFHDSWRVTPILATRLVNKEKRLLAFGKHSEDKHVTWARFGKKLDKNTTLQARDFHSDAFTKSAQKVGFLIKVVTSQIVETTSRFTNDVVRIAWGRRQHEE